MWCRLWLQQRHHAECARLQSLPLVEGDQRDHQSEESLAFGQAQSHLAHSIVAPHQLMAQLVTIELKPWSRSGTGTLTASTPRGTASLLMVHPVRLGPSSPPLYATCPQAVPLAAVFVVPQGPPARC
jgi:hypothetical protein